MIPALRKNERVQTSLVYIACSEPAKSTQWGQASANPRNPHPLNNKNPEQNNQVLPIKRRNTTEKD